MAEIIGLGCTHYPGLLQPDDQLPGGFHHLLTAPNVPAQYKDRANWPSELLAELGNDAGVSSARRYGARMADDFRAVRKALDDFNPDLVLIWGDDQYENFREDIIPAFCVFGLDKEFALKPWHNGNGGKPNRWGEPGDWTMKLTGARDAAKHLASALIERGIDMAYAYKPLHVDGLAHAFTNTLLYLDWDRRGFPWPVLPFAINCYGRNLIHAKGGMAALFVPPRDERELPDPPAPQPWRCMDVGKAVAEVLAESPWRVALIASSSWSHCFLSPTNGYLWPDHKADRLMFDALSSGDYAYWRQRPLKAMEQAGQHEMLNWMALAGAMEGLGRTQPVVHDYAETHIFMSEKCFVSYPA
jgi:Catalytic LigB subunit of aromatic ring-opening dioxygenase